MERENIVQKIKKCLRLHEGAKKIGSVEEAETAWAMAQKLMTEHHVSMTEAQFDAEHDKLKENVTESSTEAIKTALWRKVIPRVVDILCDTDHYFSYKPGIGKVIMFVGLQNDIDLAIMLHVELLRTVQRLRRGYHGSLNTFSYGVAYRLLERARVFKKAESVPVNTTALMVVKKREVQVFMEQKGLVYRNGRQPGRSYGNDDFEAGKRAGDTVPLSRPGRKMLSY